MKYSHVLPIILLCISLGCGGGGGNSGQVSPTPPPSPLAGSGLAEGTWVGTIQPSGIGQAPLNIEGIALFTGEFRLLAASGLDNPQYYNFTVTLNLSHSNSSITGNGLIYGVASGTTTGNLPVQLAGTVSGDSFTGNFTGGASGTFTFSRTQDYNQSVDSKYFIGNTYIDDKHTSTGSLINLTVNSDGSFTNCPTSNLGPISGQITQVAAGRNQFTITLNSPINGSATGIGYYVYSSGNIKWLAVYCGSPAWQFAAHVSK